MATLKDAINTARQEPDSERSIKLMAAIHSGKMDSIATQEGLNLTNFKEKTRPQGLSESLGKGLSYLAPQNIGQNAINAVKGIAQAGHNAGVGIDIQPATQTENKPSGDYLGKGLVEGVGNAAATVGGGMLRNLPIVGGAFQTADNYQQMQKNINPETRDLPPEQPISTGLVVGGAKSLGETALGLGQLGTKALSAVTEPIVSAIRPAVQGVTEPLVGQLGQAPTTQDINRQMQQTKESLTTPTTAAESVGKTIGDIGQFMIPFPGGQAAKATSLLGKAVNLGKMAAKEGLMSGAVTAAKEGDINQNVIQTAELSAAIPLIAAPLKAAVNYYRASKPALAAEQIAKIIRPDKNAYLFGKNPALGVAQEGIVANNLDDLVNKISEKSNEIGTQVENNILKSSQRGSTVAQKSSKVGDLIQKNAEKFGEEVTDKNVWKSYSDKLSQLTGEYKPDLKTGELVKIADKDLSKMSAAEIWQMQKKVGKLTQWTGAVGETQANKALHSLYGELGRELEKLAPGTAKLRDRWANMIGAEKAAIARKAVEMRNTNILTNLAGAGLGSSLGGMASGGDWQGNVKGAIIGAILPKILRSPALLTRAANVLSKETGHTPEVVSSILAASAKLKLSEKKKK